jgi:hypothetical protein
VTKSRMMEKRFSIHEGDGERIYIDDDDFHWDALLRVSGDFESCEEKKRYAQAICDVLNAAEDSIPYRPAAETSAVRPDSCHCPSVPGEDCKLTAAECERRTQMNR